MRVSAWQIKPFCCWHALLLALSMCYADRASATLTCHVDLHGHPIQGLYCLQSLTLFQLMPVCDLLYGPLQDGCMHAWQHMWSSHIDHQCMCQSCCSLSRSVLLFLPVLTLVHRVYRMCAGLEVMLLLLARMAHALETGTALGCRLRRLPSTLLKSVNFPFFVWEWHMHWRVAHGLQGGQQTLLLCATE